MKTTLSPLNNFIGSIAFTLVFVSMTGCALTKQAPLKEEKLNCAFLSSDCAQLKPGGEGQAAYRYIAPSVRWTQYDKVIIHPVTFWAGKDCTLSAADQQSLVNFFQKSLLEQLGKNYKIVTSPQVGAITIQVALVDADAATPFLRSVSMIIPQLHMLATLSSFVTGSYPFVGSAQAEAKLTDSMTGQVLAEVADKRIGGGAMRSGFQWQWGDAENVCTEWATKLSTTLKSWTTGSATP